MLDNPVIEVAIALILMFYLAAVVSSSLVEWLSNLMKKRSKYLLRAVRDLLEGPATPQQAGELTSMATGLAQAGKERLLYQQALAQPTIQPTDQPTIQPTIQPTNPAADQAGPVTVQQVMSHPLIEALKQKQADGLITRMPSYVPSRTFALALLDLLDSRSSGNDRLERIKGATESLPNETLKSALQALIKHSGESADKLEKSIAQWYDDSMDRSAAPTSAGPSGG